MKIMVLWLCIGIASFTAIQWANPTIVRAVAIENNVARYMNEQPYTAALNAAKTGEMWLVIKYKRGENTTFVITPTPSKDWRDTTCIEQVRMANKPIYTTSICKETVLDLSPYLSEGLNGMALEIHAEEPEAAIYVSPKLVGAQAFSTAGCLGLFAVAAALLMYTARAMGLNTASGGIAVLGMAYFSFWLYFWPNLSYTADLPGHLPYILHMIDHWMQPYDYHGHEEFHPPLYYFIAARVFHLFDTGPINPLTAVRAFSIAMYMVFCLYGLATLRLTTRKIGLAYYVGCALIVFWPAGILKATNINNDIPMYALWGAVFYYIVRSFQERSIGCLQAAVVLTGVAFMVKSNAWVPLGITGACALYGLYSGKWSWRQWFSRRSLMAAGVLCLGIIANMGRIIYMKFFHQQNVVMEYFGYPRQDIHPFSYFVRFDIASFIEHPFVMFDKEPAFLNFFLKSMLYNESSCNAPHFLPFLLSLLNILLLLWFAITIFGVLMRLINSRQERAGLYLHIIAVTVSVVASMMFTFVDRYVFCQNFRYVLPMLIPLVILFVRGMETANDNRFFKPLYWFGVTTSVLLITGSVILYLSQYISF